MDPFDFCVYMDRCYIYQTVPICFQLVPQENTKNHGCYKLPLEFVPISYDNHEIFREWNFVFLAFKDILAGKSVSTSYATSSKYRDI